MSDLGFLRSAFEHSRLAAVHVDLQACYFDEETMAAYPKVNRLAALMREKSIPNHWVTFTRNWTVLTPWQYAQKYRDTRLDFHRTIDVDTRELIFEKAARSAFDFQEAPLHRELAAHQTEAVIISGVRHNACVAETVAGALMKNFRVFAALDATDCRPAEASFWRKSMLHLLQSPQHDHLLTVTTTHDIRRALSP